MNVLFDDVISIRGIRIKQLAEQITCKHETTNIELKKNTKKVVQIMAQEIHIRNQIFQLLVSIKFTENESISYISIQYKKKAENKTSGILGKVTFTSGTEQKIK